MSIYNTIKLFNKEINKSENNINKTIWRLSYTKDESHRVYLMNFTHYFDKIVKNQLQELLDWCDVVKKWMKYTKAQINNIVKFEWYINKYLQWKQK